MSQISLYIPMFAYVLYMWFLLVYNLKVRLNAVKLGHVDGRYFKTYSGALESEKVIVTGRHLDNQFQLPLLFFITCLMQMQINAVGSLTVIAAWGFVVSRVLHAYIHLGKNHPLKRAKAYALGWLCILFMWSAGLYHLMTHAL